eukprot:5232858-Pyramimonas_sp.AAC.1
MGEPKGTDSVSTRTAPGVHSHQDVVANPAKGNEGLPGGRHRGQWAKGRGMGTFSLLWHHSEGSSFTDR